MSLQVGGFKRKSMPSFSLHRLLYTYVRGRILTVNGVCFLPTPRRSEDHSCGPGQRISSVHLLLCLALCEPINCSTPGCPVHHQSLELTHTHVHWVGDAIQPSHPLSSPENSRLQSFPASGFFSNESVLCIRWPKYWNFSFNISPSNGYSGLISFRMDSWISLQSRGLSRILFNTTVQKHQFFGAQLSS